MAIVFEMWAECRTQENCYALKQHFEALNNVFTTGRNISWRATIAPWLSTALTVWSPELSNVGIRTMTDAIETTEAGIRLYHHLKSGASI